MKFRHALHAIAHMLRRQPEYVRALCALLPAPPVLSPDERYPFASPDNKGWMAILCVSHRVRTDESGSPVYAGWAYCKWQHFVAHVLVAGWPQRRKVFKRRGQSLNGGTL